jgi:hypothetical protein
MIIILPSASVICYKPAKYRSMMLNKILQETSTEKSHTACPTKLTLSNTWKAKFPYNASNTGENDESCLVEHGQV